MGEDIHAVGVCGSGEAMGKIWVDCVWELRPGVTRGVVHRSCWEALLRREWDNAPV